jgi:hypothetical protein
VVRYLDGSHDRDDLCRALTPMAVQGMLPLLGISHSLRDASKIQAVLATEIEDCLRKLASSGLLSS